MELHVYRILRVGRYQARRERSGGTVKKQPHNTDISRCVGGGIQFISSPASVFQTGPLSLCGDNQRYSPPVVMFLDQGSPVLLVGVDQKTPRSQFLAHFSFTPASAGETGLRMDGGTRMKTSGKELSKEISS